MNRHAKEYLDFYRRNPEPLPPQKKKAKPPEPVFDHKEMADKLYIIFETIKQVPTLSSWVLEDLLDVINELSPGYTHDLNNDDQAIEDILNE